MIDLLVVGAGFAGSVLAERFASQDSAQVLVIDQRAHVGGNAYDAPNEHGVLIHRYGPHIFHTNSDEVLAYLSQFTAWRAYEHRVRTWVGGQYLPIPINLDTVNRLYGWSLTSEALTAYLAQVAEPRDRIETAEDAVVSKVGRDLYEQFYRGYTRKQWGRDPSQLSAQVTARIPIRTNQDDRYFTDRYQCMPRDGYTALFARLLDHPNITVRLNTRYEEVREQIPHRRLVWTGPLDERFRWRLGVLPYRSLQFREITYPVPWVQSWGSINYPNDFDYTRRTEMKHLTGQVHAHTTVVEEVPQADGEPYYPIPEPTSQALAQAYRLLAEKEPFTLMAGRLGSYQYFNMDQVVGQALARWRQAHERQWLWSDGE